MAVPNWQYQFLSNTSERKVFKKLEKRSKNIKRQENKNDLKPEFSQCYHYFWTGKSSNSLQCKIRLADNYTLLLLWYPYGVLACE